MDDSKHTARLRPARATHMPLPERGDTPDLIERLKQEWECTADSLPQLVCLLDCDGAIIRANRTVERWRMGKLRAVRGRNMHQLLHPGCAASDCALDLFWQSAVSAAGHGHSCECEIEDGVLQRHLRLHAEPLSRTRSQSATLHGSSAALVAVVEDISALKRTERQLQLLNQQLEQRVQERVAELVRTNARLKQEIESRRRAEQALRRSADEIQDLYDHAPCGYHSLDRHGRFLRINQTELDWLGYRRDEVIGRLGLPDLLTPESRQTFAIHFPRLVEGATAYNVEFDLLRRDGSILRGLVSASAVRDAHGRFVMSRATVFDISERRRMEQSLRESESQLRTLALQVMAAQEKERQRIAAELHDGIGQTLSAVKFYVETAVKRLERASPQDSAPFFEMIVARIQNAIEEVRHISMDLRPSILDDLGVLAALNWFWREYATIYQGIRVAPRLAIEEDDIPAPLKVAIFRIIQEAMNNSAKHSAADCIEIGLQRLADGSIELVIRDNGRGFDLKAAQRAHYRSGSGIGLGSMRERAEACGGRYLIQARKGAGTTIRALWPAAPAPDH